MTHTDPTDTDLRLVDRFGPAPTGPDDDVLTAARRQLQEHTAAARRTHAPRRRTARVGGALVGTLAVGFAGVAAATGDLALGYDSFSAVFSHWGDDSEAGSTGPATATRAATLPGPDGTVFSVMTTPGDARCYTSVLETAASAAQPQPTSFVPTSDNFCTSDPDGEGWSGGAFKLDGTSFAYDIPGVDLSPEYGLAGYTGNAGDAVRVEVVTPDDTTYPSVLVDGMFWGWFPAEEAGYVVGYAEDGSVVGRDYAGRGNVPGAPES
ncbi:hypothetical protein [Nocardioides yefusunii]|uniref:Uncharacterized protein n=1 Tax=Nocardioides yefusunii TaxID=2500546 RepID=A0ABW1R3I1_9ACTN|nr:hypothetical protein [Nocardioides yefusunii]